MNGIGVNEAGSGMAIRSGSLGSWPMAPTAYPANPTPSVASRLDGLDGHQLGARLAAQVDEQREDELRP